MGKCREIKDDFKKIDDFIDKTLKESILPNKKSLNIYKGEGGDAKIRRENLCFYFEEIDKKIDELKKRNQSCPLYLFIGEAPGRWGCFRTGIPFTDINTLAENKFFEDKRKETCSYIASFEGKKFRKEYSSTIVWKCMSDLYGPKYEAEISFPLFWNIYPFHPSTKTISESTTAEGRENRAPNANERELGMKILNDLFNRFPNINKIYTIGKKAQRSLETKKAKDILTNGNAKKVLEYFLEDPVKFYIRHPANGGKEEFIEKFKSACKSKPRE